MLKRMKVVIKMVKIVWGLEKYQGSSETLKRIYFDFDEIIQLAKDLSLQK